MFVSTCTRSLVRVNLLAHQLRCDSSRRPFYNEILYSKWENIFIGRACDAGTYPHDTYDMHTLVPLLNTRKGDNNTYYTLISVSYVHSVFYTSARIEILWNSKSYSNNLMYIQAMCRSVVVAGTRVRYRSILRKSKTEFSTNASQQNN